MELMNQAKKFAVKQALTYMDKNPEENIPKLIDFLEKFSAKGTLKKEISAVGEVLKNPDNNWYKLVKSLWEDIDSGVRNRLFENFIINASMLGYEKQCENKEKYNCNIPWAILMDPTSACNLKCTGCWAAEYGNHMNLTLEEMDNIIKQGKELGTYVYLYTGGEPMVRKYDLIKLCEMHPDCVFSSFTNGTLIDEAFADEMLRVKNFIPAISIEGFEEATDFRRGNGTYSKIIKAMEILKAKKLPFGISCCYTSANAEVIGSEEYFDYMIELGAKFAWFFTYMPVGKGAVTSLMATAEQREMMYHKIREYRSTKPLFTVDFWNDGEYVGGCIAGGRSYCHINANGDVEPCAFIHYSDSNIREKTLLEAYQSPLFMGYHDNQPFNDNMLRPCPVLDNPGKLTEIVEKSQAKSTDYQNLNLQRNTLISVLKLLISGHQWQIDYGNVQDIVLDAVNMSKKIYILLSRLPDSGSKVFGLFSGSYYTHASIGLAEERSLFYSFQINGFVRENIKSYIKNGRKPYPCEVYSISVNEDKYQRVKLLLDEFINHKSSYHYTKLGLLLSILRISYTKKNHYFCSYFVAEVLERCGVIKFPRKTNLYLPEHFKKCVSLEQEFKGDVKSWCFG